MSDKIGYCDVEGCERPCCATHNCQKRHGTGVYGGCKCVKHVRMAKMKFNPDGTQTWRE